MNREGKTERIVLGGARDNSRSRRSNSERDKDRKSSSVEQETKAAPDD